MTGHAESGPDGQDIVCAAVSALTITTVNGLERVLKKKPPLPRMWPMGVPRGYLH
ncbi:ribosomal-processing cysteine protease Prp [Limosilactobacillus fermentum]|nr:ribosomal-processing cysteine protease Prp [Limosilactobacillus fermentum]